MDSFACKFNVLSSRSLWNSRTQLHAKAGLHGLNVGFQGSGLRRKIPQGCRSKVGMKAGEIPGFGLKYLQSRRRLA